MVKTNKMTTTKKVEFKLPSTKLRPVREYEIVVNTQGKYSISFQILKEGRQIYSDSLSIEGTEISCGIREISGLATNQELSCVYRAFGEEKATTILQEMLISVLDRIKTDPDKNGTACAFILISNNNETSASRINSLLDAIATSTEWRKNPNSGNNIKIWIY